MKTFYSTDHDVHFPVGAASVVMAETEEEAVYLLAQQLRKHGLEASKGFTVKELQPGEAVVLNDGDY